MDGKPDMPVDIETTAVTQRLEETRARIGETVEALAYKTDVPARASDAVADGIAVAKENLAIASDIAADQAVEVAATILETVESAKVAAADVAAVAQSSVPVAARKNAIPIAIGIAVFVAIALFVRGRSGRQSAAEAVDELPDVQKLNERVD